MLAASRADAAIAARRPSAGAAAGAASAELLTLVLQPARDAAGDARVEALLAVLCAAPCAFDLSLLGGGPWQVVHTQGQLAWRAFLPAGLRSAVAAQAFDPVTLSAVNSVTAFDGFLRLTAEGSFALEDARTATATPVRCTARIERGALALGDALRLPLPIRGAGMFEVCYVDARLRVFRSATGLAVQVPQRQQPGARAAE